MATCTLKIYDTKLSPERNAVVEDLAYYLANEATLKLTVDNFQYQKIELDKVIKIQASQTYQSSKIGNYVDIYQDSKHYYYFVIGNPRWLSESAVELQISIDSINTFTDYHFTEKTNIIRQHKDRYLNTDKFNTAGFTLHKKVDKVPEGIGDVVMEKSIDYKVEDKVTTQQVSTNYYLIYRTPEDISQDNPQPLEIALVSKDDVRVDTGYAATKTITASNLTAGKIYMMTYVDNIDGIYRASLNDSTITTGKILYFRIYPSDTSKISYDLVNAGTTPALTGTAAANTSSITFKTGCNFAFVDSTVITQLYDIERLITKFMIKAGSTDYRILRKLSEVALYDTRILKILELPYLPYEFTWTGDVLTIPAGWSLNSYNELVLDNYTTEWERTLPSITLANLDKSISAITKGDFVTQTYNEEYESKLLNSDIYTLKLLYDSVSTPIKYEQLERTSNSTPALNLKFKPSNTLTSELLFKFTPVNATYKEKGDYETFLLSNRNNEKSLYTSDYLNYIRTGYNYDLKNKSTATEQAYINAGASIIGSAISAAAAIPTGGLSLTVTMSLAITAVTNISNAIATTVNQERAIQEKLDTYKRQASNVSANNAIDLFNYYGDNKLRIIEYQMSDKMKKNVLDLFHYCGYADGTQGIPNGTSRYWFNYLQCTPYFDEAWMSTYKDYYNDIKARFEAGVTVYHKHADLGLTSAYDWSQQYENFETNLFN